MLAIEEITPASAGAVLPDLIELLRDSVEGGASVGFLPPLAETEARDYWGGVIADLGSGARLLLVARQDGRAAGTVQLELARKPNARHRAEVQKLLVHSAARRQGIGRALLAAVEDSARRAGRTLLVLDTLQGSAAEPLYQSHGYTLVGIIPCYAQSANGALDATAIFYKLLA